MSERLWRWDLIQKCLAGEEGGEKGQERRRGMKRERRSEEDGGEGERMGPDRTTKCVWSVFSRPVTSSPLVSCQCVVMPCHVIGGDEWREERGERRGEERGEEL